MTPNKAIEQVDAKRPNVYSEEDKFTWISEVDGMVRRLVFQEVAAEPYKYPEDGDRELLIPAPFDNVYALYVEAMMDYYNREFQNYNNSAQMFSIRFEEYKKAYIRENMPKSYGSLKI
jgi:hypothetical protein